MKKEYFDTKKKAEEARKGRIESGERDLHVFKMKKGTRKAGKFIVCSEIEYLNTY